MFMRMYIDNYVRTYVLLQKENTLHSAASTGDAAAVKKLIQSGVYVDAEDAVSY